MDIVPEKVELINSKKSPIQDEYIEKYLAEKELNLTATLDAKEAYSDADFVVIAAPNLQKSAITHEPFAHGEQPDQQHRRGSEQHIVPEGHCAQNPRLLGSNEKAAARKQYSAQFQ